MITVEEFLKKTARRRFYCEYLKANLTFCHCIERQTAEPKGTRTRVGHTAYRVQTGQDLFCRSGVCVVGKKVKKQHRKDCTHKETP